MTIKVLKTGNIFNRILTSVRRTKEYQHRISFHWRWIP